MKKEKACLIFAFIFIFAIFGVVTYLTTTFGEPKTPIDFYIFQDNKKDPAYIHTHSDYVYSIGHPRKIFNSNDSIRILLEVEEEYTNITAKYSATTEPVWTELGEFVDMGSNQYLIDCIKTYPEKTITYCVSATNKKGEIEEYYFSYVIR